MHRFTDHGADGILVVRHKDVLATKLLFEDFKNQNKDILTMIRKIHEQLVAMIQTTLSSIRIVPFNEFRSTAGTSRETQAKASDQFEGMLYQVFSNRIEVQY